MKITITTKDGKAEDIYVDDIDIKIRHPDDNYLPVDITHLKAEFSCEVITNNLLPKHQEHPFKKFFSKKQRS